MQESHRSLYQLYREHTGKVAHKWRLYLDVYEEVLAPLRERPIHFVEVGVQNGGSLEIWSRYFHAARALVGCDIDPRCAALRFDDPRVSVVVGDVNAAATVREISARADPIDVFIDDGSHVSTDIVAAFWNYFPRVRPGGIYIAEDLHCAYLPKFGGGISRLNAMTFFKLLADGIHQAYWQGQATMQALVAPFLGAAAVDPARLANDVASVAFYDSLCIVRKRPADGWGRLAGRVIVGEDAAVDPAPLAMRDEPS
jgi:hypothetical protein